MVGLIIPDNKTEINSAVIIHFVILALNYWYCHEILEILPLFPLLLMFLLSKKSAYAIYIINHRFWHTSVKQMFI